MQPLIRKATGLEIALLFLYLLPELLETAGATSWLRARGVAHTDAHGQWGHPHDGRFLMSDVEDFPGLADLGMEADVYLIARTELGTILQFVIRKTNLADDWNWATWIPPGPLALTRQPPPQWKGAVRPGVKIWGSTCLAVC